MIVLRNNISNSRPTPATQLILAASLHLQSAASFRDGKDDARRTDGIRLALASRFCSKTGDGDTTGRLSSLQPCSRDSVSPSGCSSALLSFRDGNYEDDVPKSAVCPGCGIRMQGENPNLPGFFITPSCKGLYYKLDSHISNVSSESELSNSVKMGAVFAPKTLDENPILTPNKSGKPIVCARCHSLRFYGKVKNPVVENLLPEFDFDHTIGRRLISTTGARSVVLLLVDAIDFDGTFPTRVVRLLTKSIEENFTTWKKGKSGNVPRLVLVVTKIDLLPSSVSPTGFEYWVRQRARDGGASVIKTVHLVSALKNWGVNDLLQDVIELAGPRGSVWAVGSQNAGKSTLINALGMCVSGKDGGKISHLTEAPVPGTTLGIVRVEGVLPGKAKLLDTPGLLNPHQITTRLTWEEQKLVLVTKEMKPRTYRIKKSHSIHVGGLVRLDLEEISCETVYVTVWASPRIPLHMGKTENAEALLESHLGHQLQPPIGGSRVQELGKWTRREFKIAGNSWRSNTVDIAAAGLGWFAIGIKGEAIFGLWTYDGVDVAVRNSLAPNRSKDFEVAGFSVSEIVSQADHFSSQPLRPPPGDNSKKKKKNQVEESNRILV